METTLHKQLKQLYGGENGRSEVSVGGFRVDAVVGETLVEVQLGKLLAIRQKLGRLLQDHKVLVIKPVVTGTIYHWYDRSGGLLLRRYQSRQNAAWSFFQELVYLTNIFPHGNLTIQIPFVTLEDHRLSPRFVRRIRRRRATILDVRLAWIQHQTVLSTARDVMKLLPSDMPLLLSTPMLERFLRISPWQAQQILYCLRKFGLIRQVGYKNRFRIYEWAIDPFELPRTVDHFSPTDGLKFPDHQSHPGKLENLGWPGDLGEAEKAA